MTNDYNCMCKFDLEKHRASMKTFNYLEIVILPDGTVEYAVPSHQRKLENICKVMTSEQDFTKRLQDPEAFADYMQWLCNYSGCVCVWDSFCIKPKDITQAQLDTIKVLSQTYYTHGYNLKLYQGEI